MKLEEKLTALIKRAESLDDSIPAMLSKQIEVYCEALMIAGRLHAAAQFDYGKAYAERKKTYGISLAETPGTQREKEGQAEQDAYEYRLIEAKYEAALVKYKNLFVSIQELINAKKKTLELLRIELTGK